ncbi:phosphopantetheine-binding protein [Streptomyces sp. NPDC091272]|uniref:phosphopantetheine-binding protein n=1 Tax=Streptomyces sp. NPDC091272 TaxID=3365981 RepID=UPI003821AE71
MTNDQFENLLRARLPYLPADQPLRDDANLTQLGLDSMQAMELLFDIEEEAGITVPDSAMNAETFATPSSLRAVVDQQAAEEAA